MPAFTTLNCMLTLWRVNGCQFWNLPDVENISLEGSDDGNDDDDAVGAVAVITREEESLYVLILACELCNCCVLKDDLLQLSRNYSQVLHEKRT